MGRIESEHHENQRPVVEGVEEAGALRRCLDVARATDIPWTLNHPDVGRRAGLDPQEYEQRFADPACAQLLSPRTL